MTNSIKISALLFLFFSFLSCNKEADFEPGVFDNSEETLIENDLILVRLQENQEQVKLIIEDLLNTSDDRDAEPPLFDYFSLKVDANNNNLIDSNIDKLYGIGNNGANCMSFIITQFSITGCTEEEGYSYEASFESSSKSSEEHIIYELVINKENLSNNSGTVGLVFILNGQDSGGAIPSNPTRPFRETIELKL